MSGSTSWADVAGTVPEVEEKIPNIPFPPPQRETQEPSSDPLASGSENPAATATSSLQEPCEDEVKPEASSSTSTAANSSSAAPQEPSKNELKPEASSVKFGSKPVPIAEDGTIKLDRLKKLEVQNRSLNKKLQDYDETVDGMQRTNERLEEELGESQEVIADLRQKLEQVPALRKLAEES